MLRPVYAQVSSRMKVSVSDREFPALTSRSGTSPAAVHDGWRPDALVFVPAERAMHDESVPVRRLRVQSPRFLQVRRVRLAVIVDC